MDRQRHLLIFLIIMVGLATSTWAQGYRRTTVVRHQHGPRQPSKPSPFQFVLEGGGASPIGDLGADYIGTEKGFGAQTGYELGARLRYFIGPTTAVGPAFHYTSFGSWDGVYQDEAYQISTRVLRYGLDIQQFLAPAKALVRPYITLGVALCNNRYEDWAQYSGTFETSTNDFAFGAGGGLVMGPIELSAFYNYNEVDNRVLADAWDLDSSIFDWSYWVFRAGIAFGGP